MEVQGLVFAGTATTEREATSTFLRDVLGLTSSLLAGIEADLFTLPERHCIRRRSRRLTG